MPDVILYLIELNLVLLVLFMTFRLFFEKDRNFRSRRIFLMGMMLLSIILPLIPDTIKATASRFSPVAIPLDGITIYASTPEFQTQEGLSVLQMVSYIYLGILALGFLRLLLQVSGILITVRKSVKMNIQGFTIRASKQLHASSFFGYIFINPDHLEAESIGHILRHESIHQKEWHSVDRILTETFCLLNWFNPIAWMYRRAVIRNLEFLADSAVIDQGTNSSEYQLSMINQYIGSASITNQFSSQLKNRINMLNKTYKRGSHWKLFLILPMITLAFILISCSEKEKADEIYAVDQQASTEADNWKDAELFYQVDDMPTFNGGDPAMEFRKYIARSVKYPKEAAENEVSGRVIISFIVTSTGEVMVPENEYIAEQTGKNLDEVVVVSYRNMSEENPAPDEKYQQLLMDEAVRVVSSSPKWTPGKIDGKAVNVMFTFPINFVLQ